MAERLSLIVAVEAYQDEAVPPAPLAEADGPAFAAALERLGFAREHQTVLLGHQATRTAVESRLRKLAKSAPAEALFVFFAGHAFGTRGKGYLTCADSQLDDVTETSVELRALLDALKACKAERLALFLDPRPDLPDAQPLPMKELEAFFGKPGRACFLSCKPGETSHASGPLKGGAWARLVLQALSGQAPLALQDGHLVTAASLQNYLEQELPRSLRAGFKDAQPQTPALIAADRSLVLADVAGLLGASTEAVADPRLQPLRRASLRAEASMRVKSLSGYRKFHRLPDRVNDYAQKFVADLAAEDLKADVGSYYELVREHLGYKRRDVEAACDRGSGFVRTPDFEYSVSVSVAPDDPTTVVWRREVGGIRNPEVILGRPFAAVFGELFDTLVFEFVKPFDLETWVDRVEDEVPEGVKVRCASDCSSCEVTVAGFAGVVRLRRDGVEVEGRKGPSSRGLVEAFLQFQDLFSGQRDLQALPLGATPGR